MQEMQEQEWIKPVILALDGMDPHTAIHTADILQDVIGGVKVNDLLDLRGISIIRTLKRIKLMVMADPKIKDIPRTITRRVNHYVDAGADFVTVMADNSRDSLEAAVEATEGSDTRVVAVTVLTSIGEEECSKIYGIDPVNGVYRFARKAVQTGISAVVCSPQELEIFSDPCLRGLVKITPGIRLADQDKEDQKRVTTPNQAIEAGANLLVIGSAILKAGDRSTGARKEAARKILQQIEEARKKR